MQFKSYILSIILLSLSTARNFIPSGFPNGGDDTNNPTLFELKIGENRTTLIIYAFHGVWFGIGFGGKTMATATHSIIISDQYPNPTVEDRAVVDEAPGTVLATGLWTNDLFDTSGVAKSPPEAVKIVLSRDNDVSAICPSCYTFDPNVDVLDMIMAKGASTPTDEITYGYHGNGNNKKGETVYASPITTDPTEMPTFVPTMDPTRQPTQVPIAEDCVYSDDILDGVTMKIQRDIGNERILITVENDITNGNDNWFGYGFGNDQMNGTYAVIGGIDGQTVSERRLGSSSIITDVVGTEINTDNTYTSNTINGKRVIQVVRPYSVEGTYDFNKFINCVDGMYKLPVIAAKGQESTFSTYHGANNRGRGVIKNFCCDFTTTGVPTYDTTTIKSTTKPPTEYTGDCPNGEVWTFPSSCDQSVCDKAGCVDKNGDGITCTIDPCGCKAICDGSGVVSQMMIGWVIGVVVILNMLMV